MPADSYLLREPLKSLFDLVTCSIWPMRTGINALEDLPNTVPDSAEDAFKIALFQAQFSLQVETLTMEKCASFWCVVPRE